MHFSPHTLHPGVLVTAEHQRSAEQELERIAADRRARRAAAPPAPAPLPDSVAIPLTTASLNSNFDAYIEIGFKGAPAASSVQLLVDSGNTVLIVPNWEDIAALPNFSTDYQVLGRGSEPWGCPANIVRGPIELFTEAGGVITLPGCVFYACTGDPPSGGSRTANFGTGCLAPWSSSGWNTPAAISFTMQAPLAYSTDHPFAEFAYASAGSIHGLFGAPRIATGSQLILHATLPANYSMLQIINDTAWMALVPKSLTIGATRTAWPGTVTSPIAMIDTGGGPVFLSDPNRFVCTGEWPNPVANPNWTASSQTCQSIDETITIELGDGSGTYSYSINTSQLASSVSGLTLVMCQNNSYMRGQQGMNTGGISALVNAILVDYQNGRVGLRPR